MSIILDALNRVQEKNHLEAGLSGEDAENYAAIKEAKRQEDLKKIKFIYMVKITLN